MLGCCEDALLFVLENIVILVWICRVFSLIIWKGLKVTFGTTPMLNVIQVLVKFLFQSKILYVVATIYITLQVLGTVELSYIITLFIPVVAEKRWLF